MRRPDVLAEITLLAEGGRQTPAHSGYRPAHKVRGDYLTTGVHDYLGCDQVLPGQTVCGTITFIQPEVCAHCLWLGQLIELLEGGRVVGHARVLEIMNRNLEIETMRVYGGFPASAGIESVASALQAQFRDAKVAFSGFGLAEPSLCFSLGPIFFSTMFLEDEDGYLFDGGVPGSLSDALDFVQRMSDCLAAAGLEHDFHVATGRHTAEGMVEYAASFVYPPADKDEET